MDVNSVCTPVFRIYVRNRATVSKCIFKGRLHGLGRGRGIVSGRSDASSIDLILKRVHAKIMTCQRRMCDRG